MEVSRQYLPDGRAEEVLAVHRSDSGISLRFFTGTNLGVQKDFNHLTILSLFLSFEMPLQGKHLRVSNT